MNREYNIPKVDSNDPTPKYLQIEKIVTSAIRSGELKPGAKLPSTKEMSALIDVSLITAHKALERLVESGWLRREVGRGTFVREDVDVSREHRRDLSIGILIDRRVNISDYYHSLIVDSLRRYACDDYHRTEFFFDNRFTLEGKGRRDTGTICVHPPVNAQHKVELLARSYALVVLGGTFPGTDVSCIDSDNKGGARQAVRHLLDLGHRRFLIFSGPAELTNSQDRTDGAIEELASVNIKTSEQDNFISEDGIVLDHNAQAEVRERLRGDNRPTAIVAGGFYLALMAIQLVRDAGLSVPQDVSIVGFDDPLSARYLDPPLTTVRQPLAEMSAKAYELIRQTILGTPPTNMKVCMPTELVVRKSTCPAPRTSI